MTYLKKRQNQRLMQQFSLNALEVLGDERGKVDEQTYD